MLVRRRTKDAGIASKASYGVLPSPWVNGQGHGGVIPLLCSLFSVPAAVQGLSIQPVGVDIAPTAVNIVPQGLNIAPTLIVIGPYDTTVAGQVSNLWDHTGQSAGPGPLISRPNAAMSLHLPCMPRQAVLDSMCLDCTSAFPNCLIRAGGQHCACPHRSRSGQGGGQSCGATGHHRHADLCPSARLALRLSWRRSIDAGRSHICLRSALWMRFRLRRSWLILHSGRLLSHSVGSLPLLGAVMGLPDMSQVA